MTGRIENRRGTLWLAVALATAGCSGDPQEVFGPGTGGSTTDMSTGTTTDPSTTTSTTSTSTDAAGTSTTDDSTTTTTSGSSGASGGTTTGVNPADPYHQCSPQGPGCGADDLCLIIVPGQLPGTCAAPCEDNAGCPDPIEGDAEPVCNIDDNDDGDGEFCNLGCSFDITACPEGMQCQTVTSGASMCLWPTE